MGYDSMYRCCMYLFQCFDLDSRFFLCLEKNGASKVKSDIRLHFFCVRGIALCYIILQWIVFQSFVSTQVPFQCLWWSMCVAPIGWESRVITRPMPRRILRCKALLLKDYLPSLSLTNPPDKALLLEGIVFSFHDPFSVKKKHLGWTKPTQPRAEPNKVARVWMMEQGIVYYKWAEFGLWTS